MAWIIPLCRSSKARRRLPFVPDGWDQAHRNRTRLKVPDLVAADLIADGLAEKPFSVSPPDRDVEPLETATLSGGPSAAVRVKKVHRRRKKKAGD